MSIKTRSCFSQSVINHEDLLVLTYIVFLGSKKKVLEVDLEAEAFLHRDPAVLLFLNIPSYMGGASDPWKASRGNWHFI